MDKLDKRKVLGTIVGVVVFLVCILFFTYAYYVWKGENVNVAINIQDVSLECTPGADIEATGLGPVLDYTDGVSATFSVRNGGSSRLLFRIGLDITSIDEELLVESFKYKLMRDSTGGTNYTEEVISGDFSNFVIGDNTLVEEESIAGNSTYSYQFIVYIDGTVYNDNNMQNKSMLANVVICGEARDNANSPNLDTGLIPVYYDESDEVWKRADSKNIDASWYNYASKKWANAVLVSDSTKRNTYLSADVGTTITDDDITAFYVWIPRFKYHVWNITRQGGAESTYAYPAFTNGIDIEFEEGTGSTGNVECTYNNKSVASDTTLADTCVYNGTDTITTASGNSNYTDAWYTHPAFTFGNKEIEGFWIGKFETTGTATSPTIKPDLTSLMIQTVSEQFTTSKIFQGYGLSSNMDAHMLTNLEWGAVAYLTHSIYGLCDGSSCRDAYINNSSGSYTGRSGGAIAGSTDLNLANVYPDNSTEVTQYNTNGYYNYKGYFIDYNGIVTTMKDESKVASTTGNITGVYDMSGGRFEYVMGNMLSSSGGFNSGSAGTNWNGTSTLDVKYYNGYSYQTNIDNCVYCLASLNRARLGDATAENTGDVNNTNVAWKPGDGITGSVSTLPYQGYPWLVRSNRFSAGYSIFSFTTFDGADVNNLTTFRSSLS